MRLSAALLTLGASAIPALAKCSADIAEKGLAMHQAKQRALELRKRQSPTDLAQQEQILDPTQECTAYYYEPVASMLSTYPPIWQIASIVSGDTEAQNAYNAIISDPNLPNIAPKGTPMGDFSNVTYNATDPDCWWSWSHCDKPKVAGIPDDVVTCPEPHTWGLTYDDGPNCTHNAFYDFLEENQLQATLYFIGSNTLDWPLQAMRGLADGHEIGVHTWSHRYSTALTNEQFFAELWYSRRAIKEVIGVTPLTWRAPFGDVDDRIRFIAMKMNLTTVLWDQDSFDWKIQSVNNPNGIPTASVVANYQDFIGAANNGTYNTHGTIVLTHELNSDTMGLAMQELPQIMANFKNVVPVATCQNRTQPYVETNYVYPNFAEWVAGQRGTTNITSGGSTTILGNQTAGATAVSSPSSTSSSGSSGSRTSASGIGAAAAAQTSSKPVQSLTSGARRSRTIFGLF